MAALALGGVEWGGTASAQGIGCAKMPSTVPQYFGFGYGAGHHAPIVRTPAQQPPRMDRRVRVAARCGTLGPAPYAPLGCYSGCYGAECAPQVPYYPDMPYQGSLQSPGLMPTPTPVANPAPHADNRQAWHPLVR
jgi:hypothetical protein